MRCGPYLLLYCVCCAEPVAQRNLWIIFEVRCLLRDLCHIQDSQTVTIACGAGECHLAMAGYSQQRRTPAFVFIVLARTFGVLFYGLESRESCRVAAVRFAKW